MNIKNIIKEELQQHYGEVRYLWVSSDESLYVSGTNGMLSPTNELTYDSILVDGLPNEEVADQIYDSLKNGWIHYVVDEVSWDTASITQEMISDLKLVKWIIGAIRDSSEDVFAQLEESKEMDDFSWADDITPSIDSCEDLLIGGKYTITGDYCFPFNKTPFTLVDIVDIGVDSVGTIVPHLVIDLYEYKVFKDYFKTHKADGKCKKKTCFFISCKSVSDPNDPTYVTIDV